MPSSALLKAFFSRLGFNDGDEAADVFVGSAEAVVGRVLRNKLVVILSAKVVLKNHLADDHIAQQQFVGVCAGRAATNPNEKGNFQVWVA